MKRCTTRTTAKVPRPTPPARDSVSAFFSLSLFERVRASGFCFGNVSLTVLFPLSFCPSCLKNNAPAARPTGGMNMAPAKHLSPPKKADDNDDDWENWGCSSSTRSAATSTYEQKKTNALPASKKFQCVPTPMEQIALGSSNSHNNNNASSTQQQVPKTPSSGRGGFGSNTNANNNKKNFTRLYRTSSPERKAASPTAQVIHSIDEAVDSVLTKSYTGLVGAVSSLASTLDAAVETTALKLDHFASQKMSPPGGRSQKSRTKEEDPMNSPNVVKMRCRESLGSNNSRTSTATSSSSSSNNNNNNNNNNSDKTSSWGNWEDDASDANKENIDPLFPQTPRRLSKHLSQQNKHLQQSNDSLSAQVDSLQKKVLEETTHRKTLQRDIDLLKKQNLGLQKRQQSKHKEEEEDKLMEQVRVQLQQLIKEKSDLTALNERLARENEQLHGFLSHMSASDEEDD